MIDSRLHHPQHLEPGDAAILRGIPAPDLARHAERNPDFRAQSALAPLEALGSDTDHRVSVEVDLDGLPDDGLVGGKAVLPQVVAQHGLCGCRGFILLCRQERAAKNGPHAQHFEVVGRGEGAIDALRLAGPGDGHIVVVIGKQAGEGL